MAAERSLWERPLRKLTESSEEIGAKTRDRERDLRDLGKEPVWNKAHPERKETAKREMKDAKGKRSKQFH